jgi:tRNA (adenine57-N1/adenine58-N1)-methyltransferase catalytic subunit
MTKKVLYKLPYMYEDDKGRIRKMDSFEKHVIEANKDFHFGAGIIKKEDMDSEGFIKVSKNDVSIFNATFSDEYSKIKRGAQTITRKDIGPIITKTGLNKDSKVIDAGAGSGGLSCFLGKIVQRVDTFDISEDNIKIVEKNITKLNLDNVTAKHKDIYKDAEFLEEEYDVFTLDVPEPWRAWKTAVKVLKLGGYLVVYSPNIIQIRETVMNKPKEFFLEETIEIIEREWRVSENLSRPVTKDFAHTAFLAFFRKIGK